MVIERSLNHGVDDLQVCRVGALLREKRIVRGGEDHVMRQRGDDTGDKQGGSELTQNSMMRQKSSIVVAEGLGMVTSQRYLNCETRILWDQNPKGIS